MNATSANASQERYSNDELSHYITNKVQEYLDTHLRDSDTHDLLSSRYASEKLEHETRRTSLTRINSSSRIQNLPALSREIIIAKNLERYYKERVAELTKQEETQKQLRVAYRYFRLPKLPTECLTSRESSVYSLQNNITSRQF